MNRVGLGLASSFRDETSQQPDLTSRASARPGFGESGTVCQGQGIQQANRLNHSSYACARKLGA